MSTLDPEHLNQTLSHPHLKAIFTAYCSAQHLENELEFWETTKEFSTVYDPAWLRIRAKAIFNHYIEGKKITPPSDVTQTLTEVVTQNRHFKEMFVPARQAVFESHLRNALRSFLQSDLYHKEYERLRRASLFVCIRSLSGLTVDAQLYCRITYDDKTITTEKTKTGVATWDEQAIHKLDIVTQQNSSFEITVLAHNKKLWKTDQTLGQAKFSLRELWDEKPRELAAELQGNSQYNGGQLTIGSVLIHRPAPGLAVGLLDFYNPLAACCSYGHFNAVQKLLAEGSPIDARMEDSRRTPLHIAVLKNRPNITQLLLHHRAEPNAVDNNCQTPLHLAALCAPGLCYMLVTAGADVNVKEIFEDGKTPSHILASQNYADALEYLLEKGADPNSRTVEGWTPLHQAVAAQSLNCVKILLLYNAKVNVASEKGVSPLDLANNLKTRSTVAQEIFDLLSKKK